MYDVLKTETEEVIVRELTAVELDEVAGGNPFSNSINSGSFAVGVVQGDYSSFANNGGTVAGQIAIIAVA